MQNNSAAPQCDGSCKQPAVINGYNRLSEYLDGVPPATLRGLVRSGVLPTIKLGQKEKSRVLFLRADIDAWIQASRTPAEIGPLAK